MRVRRWLFWTFFAVGLFTLLSAVGVYLLLRGLELAVPEIRSGSTLTVEIAGDFPEDSLYELAGPFFSIERLTLRDFLESIHGAKEDPRVGQLLLHIRRTNLGWGKTEEIRAALDAFKKEGKPVVAYVEQAGNLEYLLASVADRLYIHPQSVLDVRGLKAEVTFLRGTLDKVGIQAEFERIGPYKDAPETFTRETMSDAQREVLDSILDDLYERFVRTLAEARRLTAERVKEVLDRGPLPARLAMEAGLVDGLFYRDEVEKGLEKDGKEFRSVGVGGYQRASETVWRIGGRPRMALIYGVGTIVDGESAEDPLAGRVMGSDTIAKAFREARESDSIRAVVFRIDSPGGSDVASDVIWREAALTKEKKPVIVSMSDVAASGGYWIATASSAIVAEPTTLTGSIGIYGGKFNLEGLYEKIGLRKESVLRGQSGDFWSDSRSFSDQERVRLRKILDEGYRRFLERVSEARGKTVEEVDALGQGRVWTGAQALERGLVDDLGGIDRAIALAREKAGIPEGDSVQLVIFPRKKSVLEMLVQEMVAGGSRLSVSESLSAGRVVARSPVLQMLTEADRLALMPYRLEIR